MEDGPAGRRSYHWHHCRRLGLVALEEGPLPRPRPATDQGEGLPHRLWCGAPGHRHSAQGGFRKRPHELLGPVAAAYRHYDNPAGARFRVGKVRPTVPVPSLQPASTGLFGKRSVLGVREMACLWHPPGARDETPLVERSEPGCSSLRPEVPGAALWWARPRRAIPRYPLPRRPAATPPPLRSPHPHGEKHPHAPHRLPQAETEGRGQGPDAIVVVEPHTDLVSG